LSYPTLAHRSEAGFASGLGEGSVLLDVADAALRLAKVVRASHAGFLKMKRQDLRYDPAAYKEFAMRRTM
jgi:hypothetical protein